MKNEHKNRVRKLFDEWEQINPQFFKDNYINEDLYTEAAESLLSFLRMKKLSLIDCEIELSTEPIRWAYISICASVVISYVCGLFTPYIKDIPKEQIVGVLIVLFGALFLFVRRVAAKISKNYLDRTHFLQVVLKRYIVLYGNDLAIEHKIVELLDRKLANVPANAESIYSERMQLSKYYKNAFVITANNNGQYFDYVVYSNSDNCSPANFIRLCKEQMGKNWHGINKQQIVITKAHIEPDV